MASITVALLALLGNAAAFSLPPPAAALQNPATATAAARRNVFKQQTRVRFSPFSPATAAAASRSGQSAAAVRGGGLVLGASEEQGTADGGKSSSSRPGLDLAAVAKYIAGTAAEFGIIMGLLTLLQGNVLTRLGAKWAKATVFLTFGFLAMKSRTFSVLNARRPSVAKEKEAKVERRRPDWMPPPKVFPFIWITIGVLRAISTTMVWEALGCKLATVPIASMVLHLSIGDTWNHINNVEKKLGVAVSVVFLVWLSVANTVFRYYQVLPKAGLVLLPSLLWISVANLLVQSIWRLNGKEPLYPPK
ncbi:unnamed protein product [Scytosiphon promiscuus]